MNPEPQASPVVKVARDLTEIVDLHRRLAEQAVHQAGAKVDGTSLPGGAAMVALGPVANLEAWGNQNATDERMGLAYTSVEDEDPEEAWSPFQLLEFWSEDWRRVHEAEYGRRPTIESEANFIRWALDWAWENEPRWDDFAADVRKARVKLEDILSAGNRAERSRVPCSSEACEPQPRLIVIRGEGDTPDHHKCPACKTRYMPDDYDRALGRQMRSEGAARFVPKRDAVAVLRDQGRPGETIRKWFADLEVETYCEVGTRRVFVWWPDLWRKHLSTPTRKRAS